MSNLSTLHYYLSIGYRLVPIPLGRKGPIHKDWNLPGHCIETPADLWGVDTNSWNWGLAHAESGTCVLDIDDLPRARREFATRGLNLDYYLANHVQIDSGNPGHAKLIFTMPFWQRTEVSKQLYHREEGRPKAYLNFRCATADGRTVQDVLPPSRHPTSGRLYQWINGGPQDVKPIPQELLALWTTYLTEDAAQARRIDSEASDKVTVSQVESALEYVDPDCGREDWYRIGMSIHSAVGKSGYYLFDGWSSGGVKYAGAFDTRTVWNSFHAHSTGITFRTLWKEACKNGWTGWRVQQVLDRWDSCLADDDEYGCTYLPISTKQQILDFLEPDPVPAKQQILDFLGLEPAPVKQQITDFLELDPAPSIKQQILDFLTPEPPSVKQQILDFLEPEAPQVRTAVQKEINSWSPPTEEQICLSLLQELEVMCPLNMAETKTMLGVQKILLQALQLKNPYFTQRVTSRIKEETHWTNREMETHLKYVRSQAKEIAGDDANILIFPILNAQDRPADHSDNLRAICAFEDIRIRHNRMTHDVEIFDPSKATWYEDEKNNLQRAYIKDKCIANGMPHYRADDHINTIGADESYHPMEEYLNGVEWDGKDWFSYVASTVDVKDPQLWETTLKRWAISIVAAVREQTGSRPPRGVLVMTGEQLVGKTTWFKYLVPEGMFSEGADLNPSDRDSVKKATKYAVVELGELDATFRKSDISRLKSFISASFDEVRLPYAHAESKWKRRTIFCGTVNEPSFLRDQTGNTRYWVNDVGTINLNAMEALAKSGQIAQFWAQVDHWFQAGERWWLTPEEYDVLESNNSHYQEMDLYEELLRDVFAWPEVEDNTVDPHMGYNYSPANPMTLREISMALGLDLTRNGKDMKGLVSALQRLCGTRTALRRYVHVWDSVNNARSQEKIRDRWYFMPYFKKERTMGRVVSPNLTVVEGGRSHVQNIPSWVYS